MQKLLSKDKNLHRVVVSTISSIMPKLLIAACVDKSGIWVSIKYQQHHVFYHCDQYNKRYFLNKMIIYILFSAQTTV